MPRKLDELGGRRFGRLCVLGREGIENRQPTWRCKCDCGNEIVTYGNGLRRGSVKSCGCLVADNNRSLRERHGHARKGERSPTYRTWLAMRDRCEKSDNGTYHRYGARGIKVCERWQLFDNFLADMGERPPGLTIDRIDPERGYEPGNCRWATYSEQRRTARWEAHLGSDHHNAKLTEEDVRQIRASPEVPGVKLARAYGVGPSVICGIRKRRTWKHVP